MDWLANVMDYMIPESQRAQTTFYGNFLVMDTRLIIYMKELQRFGLKRMFP